MIYAEQRGAGLKGCANTLLFDLEVREPQCYGPNGFLREASAVYGERVGAVSIYDFQPLLYGRPQFTDWEDASGRGRKGSEERLAQHCGAPNPRSAKGRAGMFIACCQDRAPLGYHWPKGGESVSDLETVLITRFPFKTLRGLNGGLYGSYNGRLVGSKADLIAVALETFASDLAAHSSLPVMAGGSGEPEAEAHGVSVDGMAGERCPVCEEKAVIREEGCLKCRACGYSKCG